MSSWPYIEFSNLFNPNDFIEIDSSLNLAEADARYFKIAGGFVSGYTTFLSSIDVIGTLSINGSPIDLSFITGITAGTASASKALVVDASLNITGINSLSATGKITINSTVGGTVFSSIAGTSTIDLIHSLNGTALLGSTTSSSFGFRTASVERVRILSNGNFGIGTSTAAYKLDVNGATNATAYYLGGALVDISSITGITNGTAAASKALILDASLNISGINSLSTTSIIVNGTSISTADLAFLSGITPGTATVSKALVVDASRNIVNINSLTATSLAGTLTTAAQTNITSIGTLTTLTTTSTLTSGLHIVNATPETFTPGGGSAGTFTNNIRFTGGRAMGLYYDGIDLFYQWGGGGTYSLGAKIGQSGAAFCSVGSCAIGSMTINPTYKLEVTGSVNITANFLIATENIGTKLTGITNGTALASKALILDSSRNIVNINSLTATTLVGTLSTAAQTAITSVGTLTSLTISGSLTMGATVLSATELGYLTGITPGTAAASKALVLDASSNISGVNSVSIASLTLGGTVLSATELGYLTGITPGTAAAYKALVLDGNKDISSFRNVFATRFCTNTSYSNFAIDMGNTAGDRLLAVFDNGSAFYGLGANGSRLQLHSASGAGIRMYTGSSVGASGTQIFDINSASLMTCDSITLDTALTVPLANIRDNAQASGTRTEFLGIGRSSSGTDQGAWAFMNYYQTATQGDSNYFTFGPRLKTGLTTGWGMVMTQNGNVSFQDKNANGGAGGFKIQANIVGTVDIQGGITRTVGAGNGELRANATPAVYNAGTVSTRIGLWVENAIWCGDKVYVSSDKRLKRDIKPIPLDEAKKLLNVDAVSYRWKKDKFDDFVPSIGLIAQDVIDKGLDKLVSYCPNDDKENFPLGYNYGIEYSRVPIYLLELIKDLYKQLDELKRNASMD